MAKKLTQEERDAKKARKKEAREKLKNSKKSKEVTWHSFLRYLKMFFCLTQFLSFVQILFELSDGVAMTTLRWIDAALYIIMVVLLGHSIVKHDKHEGVYSFMVYGVVELSMYFIAGYIAKLNGIYTKEIGDNLVYYTIGSCVLYIPTLIYYIKRWKTDLFIK